MAEKKTNNKEENNLMNLGFAILALAACYGFASWAIDSGSLWHYGFSFVSFYFFVHYIKLVIKGWMKSNGKSKKTGRTKS